MIDRPLYRDGNPDMDQVRECMAVIRALYFQDADTIRRIAASNGSPDAHLRVLFFTSADPADANARVPDYAIIRQGGTWWLISAGTRNPSQWSGNIQGMATNPDFNGTGHYVQSWFDRLATNILARFDQALREDGTAARRVVISGHSLGGCLAFVAACKLKKTANSGTTVDCVTFGAPKTLDPAYPGPFPDSTVRVVYGGDPFPDVPPDIGSPAYRVFNPTTNVFGNALTFAHHSPALTLSPYGTVGTQEPSWWGTVGLGNAPSYSRDDHGDGRYWNALARNYDNFGGGASMPRLLQIMTDLADKPRPDLFVLPNVSDLLASPAYLNQVVYNTTAGPISDSNYQSFPRVAGGVLSVSDADPNANNRGANVATPTIKTFKVGMWFNYGRLGWSEWHYQQSTDLKTMMGADRKLNAELRNLCTTRGSLLGNSAKLEAVTVGDTSAPNQGDIYIPADTEFAGLRSTNATSQPNITTALVAKIRGADNQTTRYLRLRGLPDAYVPNIGSSNALAGKMESAVGNQALAAFYLALTGFDYKTGLTTSVPFVIRRTGRNVPDNAVGAFLKVGVADDGRWQLYITPTNLFNPGDRVIVSKVHGKGVEGLNGKAVIMEVSTDKTIYTLNRGKCSKCPTTLMYPGRVRPQTVDYTTMTFIETRRFVGSKMKKAFFVPPSHHSKQCCH